jgi:hypothetical protein
VRVRKREEKRRRERGAAAMGSSPAAICSRVCERELSDPPPCIYCILSLSLNNIDSLPWM